MEKLTGVRKIKTAVFISGAGSNLKNIIKFSKIKKAPISVDLIISNTQQAKGLNFADHFKIRKKILGYKNVKITDEAKKVVKSAMKYASLI